METGKLYTDCIRNLDDYIPGNVLQMLEEQDQIQPVKFIDGYVYYELKTSEVSENNSSSLEQSGK